LLSHHPIILFFGSKERSSLPPVQHLLAVWLAELTKVPLRIAGAQPLGDATQCAYTLSEIRSPVLLGIADSLLSSRRLLHGDTCQLLVDTRVLLCYKLVNLIHALAHLTAHLPLP
jgi:hypothetical protein